jgi:hypothetical protein
MSELARECQSNSSQPSIFQQLGEIQAPTSLFRQVTDKNDTEPTTEWVIQAAEQNLDRIVKAQEANDDMNKILNESRIDWNARLQELGYDPVNTKKVAIGDMLVVSGRELPIVIDDEVQRSFVESNYDNLTDRPMVHWRRSR